MSQATAARATRPAARPSARTLLPGRRLRVVSASASVRSRAGLVVVCLALLAAGLFALLLINISLGHGSYEMYKLQAEQKQLADQRDALSEQIADAQAPQQLAQQAAALGMVPAPQVAFLHLRNGAVSGAAVPASPAPTPTVSTTP